MKKEGVRGNKDELVMEHSKRAQPLVRNTRPRAIFAHLQSPLAESTPKGTVQEVSLLANTYNDHRAHHTIARLRPYVADLLPRGSIPYSS